MNQKKIIKTKKKIILSNKEIFQKYKFLLIKFSKLLMINGKKSKTEKIIFQLFKFLSLKNQKFPLLIFFKALKNISPLIIIQSVRVRGRSYQVPIPLKETKQIIIGMKWLIKACRNSKFTKTNSFINILNNQIYLAYQKKGELIEKKDELHKIAKTNRLFANYRWF
jgi:small subunit ribosomal protein S7